MARCRTLGDGEVAGMLVFFTIPGVSHHYLASHIIDPTNFHCSFHVASHFYSETFRATIITVKKVTPSLYG